MNHRTFARPFFLCLGLLVSARLAAQEIVTTPDHADGIYQVGQPISWKVEVRGDGAADVHSAHCIVKKGQLTVLAEKDLDLPSGGGTLATSLDEPGTVLCQITIKGAGGKEVKRLCGAVIAPTEIKPSAPKPDDFDAFWAAKIGQLNAIPANPQVEPGDAEKPGVEYAKVRLDNINGTHVYGQLAKPKREGKFPAMLIVQYAGVYGLPKANVVRRAEQGWLALNIMAHDLPLDRDPAFYKEAAATTLNNYMMIGAADRETSYFLRMYLGCYRAADYLAGRDDWDGRTLLVTGTSQGGQQTLIAAALYPKVTAMMANVPGGCDVTGPAAGRSAGFPYWANNATWKKDPKILETGRYFDVTNFAVRIRCPALVSCGLIDETCPAAGVLAAFNQIAGPKEVLVMPNSDHHGTGNAQAAFFSRSEAWARALAAGKPVPAK